MRLAAACRISCLDTVLPLPRRAPLALPTSILPLSLSALYFAIRASTSPQKARAGRERKAEK